MKPLHFTLRQLQVFVAIAHHQTVTQAAQALAMSQSACSGALKDLESQYGIQLFDRVGKRLQLNELGMRLRVDAEALLAQAANFDQQLEQRPSGGQLNVGATLTIGNYLAVGLIQAYRRAEPDARVALSVANTAAIAQALLNFDIDVGLIEGEIHHPDLEVTRWRGDELVCFCAPGHALAGTKQLTDEQILAARWIVREQGSGTRQTFDRGMHGLLPALNVELELQHTEAIKRAVEAGLGVGCLSGISLRDAFARKSLIPLPTPQRDFTRDLYIALRRQKFRGPGLSRWLTICKDQANN